jgi:uncharacterized protein
MEGIIRQLAEAGNHLPRDAMRQAIARCDEAAPGLLALLEAYAEGRDRSEAAAGAVFFILFLVAQAREPRAFPAICRLARDPEALEAALGDGITESLGAILIGTWDGDPARLLALVEDEAADEFARSAGFDALTWLAATGAVPMATAEATLRDLHGRLRPQEASFVWVGWQEAVARLGLESLRPLAEDVFRRGLVDESIMGFEDFEGDLREGVEAGAADGRLALLARHRVAPIEDAVELLSQWHGFTEAGRREKARLAERPPAWDVPQPATNPFRDVGRNDPCPCGSGKKYKKCCLAA